MRKLIEWVSHPQLCEKIVGQFAFMKAMARPEDSSFEALNNLSLNDVFEKADSFFVQFTGPLELIDTKKHALAVKITEFLSQWKEVTDVTAIQQNIHYQILIEDKA